MDQQPAFSPFFVLKVFSTHGVFANVNIEQDTGSSIFGGSNVAIANVHFAIPNALDFGAQQRDTGFHGFNDFIISSGVSVEADCVALGSGLFLRAFGEKELCR